MGVHSAGSRKFALMAEETSGNSKIGRKIPISPGGSRPRGAAARRQARGSRRIPWIARLEVGNSREFWASADGIRFSDARRSGPTLVARWTGPTSVVGPES